MKVYWYQRKDPETGKKAKEWSYRLPAELRVLPKEVWPENFNFNGTLYSQLAPSQQEIDLIIQNAKRQALLLASGVPVVSTDPIQKHIDDYLEWGKTQAGKLDDGWSPDHLKHKAYYLREWVRILGLQSLADITFDGFDRHLSHMKRDGLANNTINSWGHALSGLTKFCKKRKRMAVDLLEEWESLKKVIRNPRGHYLPEELVQLFEGTPEDDAITYQVAYYTRYREGELQDLVLESVLWTHGLIQLPEKYTKNGKIAFQPLPDDFVPVLWEYVQRRGIQPGEQLLRMSKNHPERRLYKHLDRLGIPRFRDGKKRDFHALGHSTATNMVTSGVDLATIQKGLRHGSIRQTLDYVAQEALPVRAAVNTLAQQLNVYRSSPDDSHHFHTEAGMAPVITADTSTYRGRGPKPSPSALHSKPSRTPAHSTAPERPSQKGGNSASLASRRIGAHTPYAEARNLLARISHKISDPRFAELIGKVADLSPAQLEQFTALLKASRRQGAA